MRIFHTAVLEDGQSRSAAVPSDTHLRLELPYGETLTLVFDVRTAGNVPVDMTDKDAVVTVKRSSADSQIVFSGGKTATPAGEAGMSVVEVPISLDSRWRPGRYVFDVWLHDGGNRDLLIPISTLRVVPTAGSATPTP